MLKIRPERPEEYRVVEEIVREAFWDVYRLGYNEHLILHKFRKHPNYLPGLSRLVTLDDEIIGQIMFSKAKLTHKLTGEEVAIATFGPVSILPSQQKKGYGDRLIRHGIGLAKEAGYPYLVIFGNPEYYHKFGFVSAINHGVFIDGQTEELDFVMIKDLTGRDLVTRETGPWHYQDPEGYETSQEELAAFEKGFPPKVSQRKE